jgi:hypothetical protein
MKLRVGSDILGALGAIICHLTTITHDACVGWVSRISHGKHVFHGRLRSLGCAIFGAPCGWCKGFHGLLMASIKSR